MTPEIVDHRQRYRRGKSRPSIQLHDGEVLGRVKFFCSIRDFGFVEWDGGGDIYFNHKDLARAGISRLKMQPGQPVAVRYEPNIRRDGIRVTDMRLGDTT